MLPNRLTGSFSELYNCGPSERPSEGDLQLDVQRNEVVQTA